MLNYVPSRVYCCCQGLGLPSPYESSAQLLHLFLLLGRDHVGGNPVNHVVCDVDWTVLLPYDPSFPHPRFHLASEVLVVPGTAEEGNEVGES